MPSKFLSTFNEWKPVVVLFFALCGMLIATGWGAAWYISGTVDKFDIGRQALQDQVTAIEKSVSDIRVDALEDRYTLTAASEKALRTAIENPGMRVPDPRDPSEIITVSVGSVQE